MSARAAARSSGTGASANIAERFDQNAAHPTISSRPQVGSRLTPTMTSRPGGAIACTSTPSMWAFGACRRRRASTRS
jgi:hypothetical protein